MSRVSLKGFVNFKISNCRTFKALFLSSFIEGWGSKALNHRYHFALTQINVFCT